MLFNQIQLTDAEADVQEQPFNQQKSDHSKTTTNNATDQLATSASVTEDAAVESTQPPPGCSDRVLGPVGSRSIHALQRQTTITAAAASTKLIISIQQLHPEKSQLSIMKSEMTQN